MPLFKPSARALERQANRFAPFTSFDADTDLTAELGIDELTQVLPEHWERLATSTESRRRILAARHKLIPQDLLVTLASDSDVHVRTAVASNLSATAEILDTVMSLEDNWTARQKYRWGSTVREQLLSALANHKNMSKPALETLHRHAGDRATPGRYAKERLILLKMQAAPARKTVSAAAA